MMVAPPIKLNGAVLPAQVIAEEAQHHPARTPAAAFQAAARALIIRKLLLEEARRRGVTESPEIVAEGKRETPEEAIIRQLLEQSVPLHDISEADCQAYYDGHPDRFRSPDLLEASHILFAADPRDQESAARAQSAAQTALAALSLRSDAFERLAREQSACPSKTAGGRLGQLDPGDVVPEFEAALAALEPGNFTTAPVRSRFGFHIIRLDARIAGKTLPFSYVRDTIAGFLEERQWRRDAAKFITHLVEAAQIEGVSMVAKKAA
jgi:peptidyl-prolyl cis-trans isomerase C